MKKSLTVGAALSLGVVASTLGVGLSAAGAASKPIVIGAIAGTTGAYGSTGQAVINGTQMAVAKINASGGVLGRQLKLVWGNDGASATTASLDFKKFVSEGAVAMLGSPDAATTTVALADSTHLPDLGAIDDGGPAIYPHGPSKPPAPWAWSNSLNTYAWGQAVGEYAMKSCPTGLAVLHDPTFYGLGGLAGIQESYKKPLKLNDAISEDWASGSTTSLDSEISAIKKSGADCVDVWLTPQDEAAFVNEMHSLGDHFTVLGNDETSADSTFAGLAGANANGVLSAELTAAYSPNASVKAFAAAYKKQFKIATTPFAELSYDAVFMLANAITAGHSTAPGSIQKQLNKISSYKGLTGSLTFTPQQHVTINAAQLTLVKYSTAKKAWLPAQY
ncbi:MAG TPA: ABC transporter substrate-binding protein [Acidimicrobiales bacterium]|nr:ABC transporter substrate-binding protein [Acidimicrobiales bacterium]